MTVIHKVIALLATVLLLAYPIYVSSQGTSSETYEDLRKILSESLAEGNLQTIQEVTDKLSEVKPSSITFWEEILACGFYPQESRPECIVEIKQRRGYGGPIGAVGSFEYVKFCVDRNDNNRFEGNPILGSSESVGSGNVHMHDEVGDFKPPWHYAVYRDIDLPGGPRTTLDGSNTATATDGPTLRARAILSWFYDPTHCDYVPIWGEVVDFRIRLDPIR